MKKLLRKKDILLLILAGVGDLMEEAKDPLHLVSSAYQNMYGFVPRRYKKHNFLQLVGRNLKTGDIEKVLKNEKVYLRLTSAGRNKVVRDFPITNLTKKWNGRWILLIFDIEEKKRVFRDSLRNKLISIGFGMLQESVWITPLPIGEDVWEFVESIGLKYDVFVMEVLALRLGNPRELARKIWHLDKLEEEYNDIKLETERVNQLIERYNDRYPSTMLRMVSLPNHKKSEAETPLVLVKENKENKENSLLKNSDLDKTSGHLSSGYLYRLKNRKKLLMRNLLDFAISLPPLPKDLLPNSFKDLELFRFG